MRKTILEVYAMAVCFVALVFFGGFFCSAIYHSIQYVAPEGLPSNPYTYIKFINNESFCANNKTECFDTGCDSCTANKRIRLSEDVITKKREELREADLVTIKQDDISDLLWAGIYMPVALVVFFIHWKIARRAREI